MARKSRSGSDTPNTINQADYLRIVTELIAANKEVRSATEELAAARGVVSGIIKRFEGLGGDKKVMRLLREMGKLDDTDRDAFMRTFFEYGSFESMRLYRPGTDEVPQGEMFPKETEAAKQGHRDATVNMDGYNTSKAGGTLNDNPHEPGSRDHQTWVSGFNDHQHELETKGSNGATVAKGRERDPRKKRGGKAAAEVPADVPPESEETPVDPVIDFDGEDRIGEPVGTA